MENSEKVFKLLEDTNLDWGVDKLKLCADKDGESLCTESYGLFRQDTSKWLGTVGSRYTVLQNWEMAEIIVGLQNRFGGNTRGGRLQDGKKVYLQLALPDEKIADDTVKRYVTALNSHDGTSSIGFGSSNTVVVCQNTFYMAMRDVDKIRHTATASERLDLAVKEYEKALTSDGRVMEAYKRMADYSIDKPVFQAVMDRLFNVDLDVKKKDLSTRKLNTMKEFSNVLEKELDSHGETLWGLFNAVTYYTNHVLSKGKSEEYVMTRAGYDKNLGAFKTIVNHMQEKHDVLSEMFSW